MFLIIDGSSLLFSNYYGTLPTAYAKAKTPEEQANAAAAIMHTSNGIYTNGIYGTLKTILDILSNHQDITHLAIVFDKTKNTFRRQISPDYKANRKPTPNLLQDQLARIINICQTIGIQTFLSDTYEADDLAGSIAARFQHHFHPDNPIIVMTKDHDYLQLINENVHGWIVTTSQKQADHIMSKDTETKISYPLPQKVAIFQTSTVLQEEGVFPCQIPDKKGICGDTSDNIPGIPGIGPTTALPLLAKYQTIEGIYNIIHMYDEKPETLMTMWKDNFKITKSRFEKIKQGEQNAMLSKQLATIQTKAPIPWKMNAYIRNIDRIKLQDVVTQYEFLSLSPYIQKI